MSNDTNTAFNASEMLKGFIEAGNALEELPKVRADLDAAHALLDETNAKLTAEAQAKADAEAEIARLKSELQAREAELTDTKSRHAAAQSVLDAIRGALPAVRDAVSGAVDSVADKLPAVEPEAKPEPITEGEVRDLGLEPAPGMFNPTPTEDKEPSGEAPSGTSSESSKGDEPAPVKPMPSRPWSEKPHDLSWDHWASEGGEVPYWVLDRTQC